VANIRRQRIYLFHGTKDSVVGSGPMDAVRDFYRAAGLPTANLAYESKAPAGHAFISTRIGNPDCGANGGDYIDRCTIAGMVYDQPGIILRHIYGTLQPPATQLSSAPEPFDQSKYAKAAAAMAATGYVYVPASCKAAGARCRVHVVFHGCIQSSETVKDHVYAQLGYNEWADTNKLIILYPQVDKADLRGNPNGCWDWWGYTTMPPWGFGGSGFVFRSGPQVSAIHAMIARLESAP
jgi:poly(3-hydroxybutyrate) depolymerase